MSLSLLGISVDPMAWKTQLMREITAELTAQVEVRLPPALQKQRKKRK